MKSLYSGYYGAQNSGDDAFVDVASWGASKYWGVTEHLFFASELPKIYKEVSHYSAHAGYLNFSKAIKDIFLSDIFITAGGSMFHSALTKSDLRTYVKLKKRLGFAGKTGAIGVSLGPYKSIKAENSTVNYLRTLDFLALRDTRSYLLAESYNLPYEPVRAFDLAALLPEIYNSRNNKITFNNNLNKKIVGVSICNYESLVGGELKKEEERNQYLFQVLKELSKEKDIRFRFFIFNGNERFGDKQITMNFIQKLNSGNDLAFEVIEYKKNVKATWENICACNLMISVRLHGAIFACYANVPFFLMEYHRKCTDFLKDVGQDEKFLLNPWNYSVSTITNTIMEVLNENNYIVPKNIQETKLRATWNFTKTY
jgi:polysaccharide pyruvyl transferase WcaK-like protein